MSVPSLRVDDLNVPQGADTTYQWPLRDMYGQPLATMAGWTARAEARVRASDVIALATWTTENGGIELNDSTLSLIVTHDQSSAWDWDQARYDVELISPQGQVTRVTEGTLNVSAEVTR